MKKVFSFTLAILCMAVFLFSCQNKQVTDGPYIRGELQNAPKKMVYFKKLTETGESTLDSVTTDENGKFVMTNKVNALDYYLLRVDNNNAVYLILTGGEKVEISGNAADLDNTYTVRGSKDSELIRMLNRYDRSLSDSLFKLYKSVTGNTPSAGDSLVAKFQNLYAEKMREYSKAFIEENPSSIVSLSATRYLNRETDINDFVMLEHSLSKAHPRNKYVIDFSSVVAQLKLLPIGSAAPEIVLPDPSGKVISLSSLKGKVVMIDFWASWCGPCRRENPNVVAMYNKYKNKGFEILGVSLDDNKENWVNAIKADGITWLQVSEMKKWDAQVVKSYHVEAIPFTVLLDREGKILAKGLRGAELESKLKEAL